LPGGNAPGSSEFSFRPAPVPDIVGFQASPLRFATKEEPLKKAPAPLGTGIFGP
jgi:hypothetical protein